MRDRVGALITVVVLLMVCGAMLVTAGSLVASGDLREAGIGVGIVLLVAVGLVTALGEVRLAAASARLGRRLADEGGLPEDVPERLPSGRLPAEAAQRQFALRKAQTEAAPQDWRAWFRLALAYSDARDSSAGRRAMRRAVALEKSDRAVRDERSS